MNSLRKFASMICLFGVATTLGPQLAAQQSTPPQPSQEAAPAQQAQPAQQPASPTQSESKTAPAAPPADAAPKPNADASFHGVKVADPKGKQTDAQLVFSDSTGKLVVRVADRDFLTVPYDTVDKFSYEYTKKHRVTQGAVVMVASLGAGAIVMLTKSKSHWLYIDFHEQEAAKSIVLRMDKNQYKSIMEACKTHTGKAVEDLEEGGKSKDKNKSSKSDKGSS
jgi:hypothetical protein